MNTKGKAESSIGVFDSGVGGLTVLHEMLSLMPNEHFIYFGDTARLPYGGKSPETILRYTIESSIFLMEKNIKMLVVACNTASAHAVEKLRSIFNIPIIGVIEPGAERVAQVSKNGRIAVMATKATVQSGVYQREIQKRISGAQIISLACPLLVPLVEERFVSHPSTQLIVREYLEPIKGANVDTLMLGCTHYPLLRKIIQEEAGAHITLVDSASTCASNVLDMLKTLNLESSRTERKTPNYFVTDDPEKFQIIGREFLGENIPHVNFAYNTLHRET